MQVSDIAAYTQVDLRHVRRFIADHNIPRERKHGFKGVFVDVDAYIRELRERGYLAEAAKLEAATAER